MEKTNNDNKNTSSKVIKIMNNETSTQNFKITLQDINFINESLKKQSLQTTMTSRINSSKKIKTNNLLEKDKLKKILKNNNPFAVCRKHRNKIISKYPIVQKFYYCNSKSTLISILDNLNPSWVCFLKLYMKRFFLFHCQIRKMKNQSDFIKLRQFFYEIIENSEILKNNIKITNNIIKNFCKGIMNFILIYFDSLSENLFVE